jgi:hypothetical protein
MKKLLTLLSLVLLFGCNSNKVGSDNKYIMSFAIDPSQQISIRAGSGGNNSYSPPSGTVINPGSPYNYVNFDWLVIDVFAAPDAQQYVATTTIKVENNTPVGSSAADTILIFTYIKDTSINGGTVHMYNISSNSLKTPPPIISNSEWSNGLGNNNATLVTPGSYWVQDYGFDDIGRWTVSGGALYQLTAASTISISPTFSSRAYPVDILNSKYDIDANAPGTAFDGVWQMDIKIGSNGASNNLYCETFYLAERANLNWGPSNYSDGSADGGQAGHSREIDIMETKWNGGSTTIFGPQVNIPNGGGTGWNTTNSICVNQGLEMKPWSDVGGAPTPDFITFGILISNNNLWFYAYKSNGTQWYVSDAVPLNNSSYTQKYPFVPYIGTWGDKSTTTPGGFKTGYKNFVYLKSTDSKISGKNPKDNPTSFGPVLLSSVSKKSVRKVKH